MPDLYLDLAACDVAVVQGGLTTCMELAQAGRPFLYVPLRNHFEQNHHVRHRLERYGAGRYTSYEQACDPEALAAAIVAEVTRPATHVRSRPMAPPARPPCWRSCSDARARPHTSGLVRRGRLDIHYEVYGAGDPAVFLLMPDSIVHSEAWKGQIPFLAGCCTVVTMDPRGNGGSSAPSNAAEMIFQESVDDAWSVLDAVGLEQAVLVGLCTGAGLAVTMAAERPERVLGVVAINPGLQLTAPLPHRIAYDFDEVLDTDAGWAKQNRHYWLRDWTGWAEFFFGQMFPEPHSTKQVEDCVNWANQAGVDTMLLEMASGGDRSDHLRRSCRHRRAGALPCWSSSARRTGARTRSGVPGWPKSPAATWS